MTDADWPIDLGGVTESVVTTRAPDGRWNAAALGVRAPGEDADATADAGRATARTWGCTRTYRNFRREGGGYVQFVRDPVVFAEAALGVHEVDDPVLAAADAWVEVSVDRVDAGSDRGTDWTDWALTPVASGVERETVPVIDRGFAAVVEATVAASRLGVPGYDDDRLRARLAYFDDVARTCGDDRVREAADRVRELVDVGPDGASDRSRNESF